jgi:hypothetical protein
MPTRSSPIIWPRRSAEPHASRHNQVHRPRIDTRASNSCHAVKRHFSPLMVVAPVRWTRSQTRLPRRAMQRRMVPPSLPVRRQQHGHGRLVCGRPVCRTPSVGSGSRAVDQFGDIDDRFSTGCRRSPSGARRFLQGHKCSGLKPACPPRCCAPRPRHNALRVRIAPPTRRRSRPPP